MTCHGRDASDYDTTVDHTGLSFLTHKATEGTTITHDLYGARLNAARAAGVPVLGAYHVLRTPGNGGNGSLAQQLQFFLAYLDAHTPWWRQHPNFLLQVDAERWPYDQVSATTVKTAAALLAQAGTGKYVITYASRGQYGDTLAGIATDLWNANYDGSAAGSYPGDNWTPGWAPYSGRTPTFLQYTSTPYDKDAFRGTLEQLLTLTRSGGTMDLDYGTVRWAAPTNPNGPADRPAKVMLADLWGGEMEAGGPYDATGDPTQQSARTIRLERIEQALGDIEAKLDALATAVAKLSTPAGGTVTVSGGTLHVTGQVAGDLTLT